MRAILQPAPAIRRHADPYTAGAPRAATSGVRLAELLGRLSLAFDIAADLSYGKAVRSVVLAVELGRRAGATAEELGDTFWLSLLGHLGCAGFVQEESGDGDDGASAAVKHARRDTSLRLAEIIGAGPRVRAALTQPCVPVGLVQMGHVMETAHRRHGRAGAVAMIRRRARVDIDARLADVFAAEQADLFAAIEDPAIFDRFLGLEPGPVARADEARIDDVARTLAIFADLKCPMFVGHSTGVAALAERVARDMGLGADETRSLRRAALLHDIGRVGVPNAIWTRPGRLDWGEMERVRLHAYYTERVLSPTSVLGPVAEIAAAAHERLDGSGYPQTRVGRSLLPAARILAAADIAFAMSEPRPYREPLPPDAIATELAVEVSAGRLDATVVDAVLASLGVKPRVPLRKAHNLSDRELDVSRLIARGKMNKEIADILGISLRTVQNHVAHIFDKLGVHSRSGVAVWMVESDIVQ
jgi:HD-GYP domain-containing protein (c-di-GMP phosphodiesterase class II)